MDYHDYNDFELLSYIEENNEEASEILFKKYEPLINFFASKIFSYCKNSGLELNDLVQEGRLGLNLAINNYNYNHNKNAKFYTYAKMCIERNIISMALRSQSSKHRALNESISLEFDDDERYKINSIISDESYNPEKQVLDYENEKELAENIKNILTDFERQVFDLKLASFSYKEIAEILDRDIKSIDNALQRIKVKIKDYLNQ